MNLNKLKLVYSSSIAAIASMIFVVIITVAAEQSTSLKNSLKALSGHHWTTKSVISVVIYFVVLFLIYIITVEASPAKLRWSLSLVSVSAVLGYIVLLGFFLSHYFLG